MSGQLPSITGVYDNAAEFPSDLPTYAHHLRGADTIALVGKMHFVGPDQLHGFEERFTTDIYPADFGWTPDYRKSGDVLIGGTTTWGLSLALVLQRFPIKWSMMTTLTRR